MKSNVSDSNHIYCVQCLFLFCNFLVVIFLRTAFIDGEDEDKEEDENNVKMNIRMTAQMNDFVHHSKEYDANDFPNEEVNGFYNVFCAMLREKKLGLFGGGATEKVFEGINIVEKDGKKKVVEVMASTQYKKAIENFDPWGELHSKALQFRQEFAMKQAQKARSRTPTRVNKNNNNNNNNNYNNYNYNYSNNSNQNGNIGQNHQFLMVNDPNTRTRSASPTKTKNGWF